MIVAAEQQIAFQKAFLYSSTPQSRTDLGQLLVS